MEIGASFVEIQQRMDTGWQDRQGSSLNLEGRGFEWGRDWRIWCANLKIANRYRGVVVEVRYPKNIADIGAIYPVDVPSAFKNITHAIRGTTHLSNRRGSPSILGKTSVSPAITATQCHQGRGGRGRKWLWGVACCNAIHWNDSICHEYATKRKHDAGRLVS